MKAKFLNASVLIIAALIMAMWFFKNPPQENTHKTYSEETNSSKTQTQRKTDMTERIIKTDEQWKQMLTPEQYRITRKKGTEPAFRGEYHNFKAEGTYLCVCCENELFSSGEKFDSRTGWPSFYEPISKENIEELEDKSLSMIRTEVVCSRCGAHLGHVFGDGPKPTRLRYCINSAALKFIGKEGK